MRDTLHIRGLGDVVHKARVCAAERGITLRELVAQALIAEIALSPKVQRHAPTLPRDAPPPPAIAKAPTP